jgi:hypothetical protein
VDTICASTGDVRRQITGPICGAWQGHTTTNINLGTDQERQRHRYEMHCACTRSSRCSAAMPAPSEASSWPNLQPWLSIITQVGHPLPIMKATQGHNVSSIPTLSHDIQDRHSVSDEVTFSQDQAAEMLDGRPQEIRVSMGRLLDWGQRDLRRSRRASAPGSTGTEPRSASPLACPEAQSCRIAVL